MLSVMGCALLRWRIIVTVQRSCYTAIFLAAHMLTSKTTLPGVVRMDAIGLRRIASLVMGVRVSIIVASAPMMREGRQAAS